MLSKDSVGSITKSRSNMHPKLRILDAGFQTFYDYRSPLTTYYSYYPDPAGLSYSEESITYDTGMAYFKNVTHVKTVRSMQDAPRYWINQTFPGTTSPNYSTYRTPYWVATLTSGNLPGYPGNPNLGTTPVVLVDLPGALSRAHRNMLPRMEDIVGGTNFVNFVLELKDLKRMFGLWKGSIGVLKNLSAGVLNVSYAWQPFIRDVEQMFHGYLRMDSYLKRWNEDAKAGVIYTRHADITADVWQTDNSMESDITDSSWATFLNGHQSKFRRIRTLEEEVVVKATMAFKPNRIDLSGINYLRAHLDVLGIGDPLSIIWEAVPFSFVVDYFLSVGRFLKQFDSDFLVTPVTLVDFGYSVKSSQKYTLQVNRLVKRISNGSITEYAGGLGFYEHSSYVRKRTGLPPLPLGGKPKDVDLGLLQFHWPSLRQAFLLVNLANVLRR